MEEKRYYSVFEFGIKIGKSTATVYKMLAANNLKYKEVLDGNRKVKMIPVSELERIKIN